MTTVTIDNSRPEARALIEYLRTLSYVEVQDGEAKEEEPYYGLYYSAQEMDARLDQALKEMEEGKGRTTEEVFLKIMNTFNE